MLTLTPPTTKDKTISEIFLQKTTNTSSTYHKITSGILVILHITLVCVLSPRITFILGPMEYMINEWSKCYLEDCVIYSMPYKRGRREYVCCIRKMYV